MRLPVVHGTLERRILVNYRVDPAVLARVLPPPFRPATVNGRGIAGICLIRLGAMRPRGIPGAFGLASENAAHRVAVEWNGEEGAREGVYVPRRDTSSALNVLAGGRLFPGVHHRARFLVDETEDALSVSMRSEDGETRVEVRARVADRLPDGSVFGSVDEASDFFRRGSLGYSDTSRPGVLDGMELRTRGWAVQPLAVEAVRSTWIEDPRRFPPGSAEFDCALLMRGLPHEWVARGSLTSHRDLRTC